MTCEVYANAPRVWISPPPGKVSIKSVSVCRDRGEFALLIISRASSRHCYVHTVTSSSSLWSRRRHRPVHVMCHTRASIVRRRCTTDRADRVRHVRLWSAFCRSVIMLRACVCVVFGGSCGMGPRFTTFRQTEKKYTND